MRLYNERTKEAKIDHKFYNAREKKIWIDSDLCYKRETLQAHRKWTAKSKERSRKTCISFGLIWTYVKWRISKNIEVRKNKREKKKKRPKNSIKHNIKSLVLQYSKAQNDLVDNWLGFFASVKVKMCTRLRDKDGNKPTYNLFFGVYVNCAAWQTFPHGEIVENYRSYTIFLCGKKQRFKSFRSSNRVTSTHTKYYVEHRSSRIMNVDLCILFE